MFNRRKSTALQASRLDKMTQMMDQAVTSMEHDFDMAMQNTDPAKKLMDVLQIKDRIDKNLKQMECKVEKEGTQYRELAGMSILFGGTGTLACAVLIIVNPLFALASGASAGLVYLGNRRGKLNQKNEEVLRESFVPISARLKTLSSTIAATVELIEENDKKNVVASPDYPVLIERYPNLKKSFGEVAHKKSKDALRQKYFSHANKNEPKQLDKPKSLGVTVPKRQKG